MESKNPARFKLGKQSSLAPERHREETELQKDGDTIVPGVRLMYSANEGDVDGIREELESGISRILMAALLFMLLRVRA